MTTAFANRLLVKHLKSDVKGIVANLLFAALEDMDVENEQFFEFLRIPGPAAGEHTNISQVTVYRTPFGVLIGFRYGRDGWTDSEAFIAHELDDLHLQEEAMDQDFVAAIEAHLKRGVQNEKANRE